MCTLSKLFSTKSADILLLVKLFNFLSAIGDKSDKVKIVVNVELIVFPHQNIYVFGVEAHRLFVVLDRFAGTD